MNDTATEDLRAMVARLTAPSPDFPAFVPPARWPFTITCVIGGDACGDPIKSRAQAVREGWTGIGKFPPGLIHESSSHYGLCAECAKNHPDEADPADAAPDATLFCTPP